MTSNTTFKIFTTLFIAASLATGFAFGISQQSLPVTGASQTSQSFEIQVIQTASTAGANAVTQVSVSGKFSYSVVQSGNNAPAGNVVGQYALAAKRGNIGLLAHNYAAGSSFFTIANGDEVIVTYSNGKTKSYFVNNVLRFQASDPNDYSKPFWDSNGKEYSAKQVFNRAYKSNGLTFQTCIQNGNSMTWGLLFVQANP